MGEVVNLRQRRKAKARAEAGQAAAEARALHGRSKGERVRDADEAARKKGLLDGVKLGSCPSPEGKGR